MADNRHIQSAFGFGRILYVKNDTRRRQKNDGDDQHRNDRPRELNLRAAKDLRRLAAVIVVAAAESNDHVNKQTAHDRKDQARNCQREVRNRGDGPRWGRLRREDTRLRLGRGNRPAQNYRDEKGQRYLPAREQEVPTPGASNISRPSDAFGRRDSHVKNQPRRFFRVASELGSIFECDQPIPPNIGFARAVITTRRRREENLFVSEINFNDGVRRATCPTRSKILNRAHILNTRFRSDLYVRDQFDRTG